jgi:hypothetical protein
VRTGGSSAVHTRASNHEALALPDGAGRKMVLVAVAPHTADGSSKHEMDAVMEASEVRFA